MCRCTTSEKISGLSGRSFFVMFDVSKLYWKKEVYFISGLTFDFDVLWIPDINITPVDLKRGVGGPGLSGERKRLLSILRL